MDVDHQVGRYFCIFCPATLEDIRVAYNHYSSHMSVDYYCFNCDGNIDADKSEKCDLHHDARVDVNSEQTIIAMWIERFLSYQEELKDKSWRTLITENKFYKGCPACDAIGNLFSSQIAGTSLPSNLIQGSIKTHLSRHVNSHIRYYPYECLQCERIGKYNKKTDLSEMTRHMKRSHQKTLKNYETANLVRQVKITKLESFFESYIKSSSSHSNKNNINHDRRINILETSYPQMPALTPVRFNPISNSFTSLKDQTNKDMPKLSGQNKQETDSNGIITKPKVETILTNSKPHSGIPSDDDEMDMTCGTRTENPDTIYFCLFCPQKLAVKEEAYRHYQVHLEYYPITCLICKKTLTDVKALQSHHLKEHPELTKGKFKKKERVKIDKWIEGFLYSQATIIRTFPPREQCPVCDVVFTEKEIAAQKPRRCTVNRKIDHAHRHLSYLPYECLLCKENGVEFNVAYFESKAHSHIKQKHPEIDIDESRWNIFQKTISIPILDDFVRDYLSRFGISMDFERRPTKKQSMPKSIEELTSSYSNVKSSIEDPKVNVISYSNVGQNMVSKDLTNTSKDSFEEMPKSLLETVLANQTENDEDSCIESEGSQLVIDVMPQSLIYENNKSSTSTTEKYFCLFCTAKFATKLEAFPHYGEHLDYLPVVCKICGGRTANIDCFIKHHRKIHPRDADLNYEIREDHVLMKWVDDFLDSQGKLSSCRSKILPCGCRNSCPMCVKLIDKSNNTQVTFCSEHNDVAFSDHIHQHLVYFPYECSICRRNGKIVRVPNLDVMALEHVKEHNMPNATMYQLCRNFPKTLGIPLLEKFIGEQVHKKRLLERKGKAMQSDSSVGLQLNLNLTSQSQFIISTNTNSITTNSNLNNFPITSSTLSSNHNQNGIKTYQKMKSNQLQRVQSSATISSVKRKKVEHIRVVDGRVVNLPPLRRIFD